MSRILLVLLILPVSSGCVLTGSRTLASPVSVQEYRDYLRQQSKDLYLETYRDLDALYPKFAHQVIEMSSVLVRIYEWEKSHSDSRWFLDQSRRLFLDFVQRGTTSYGSGFFYGFPFLDAYQRLKLAGQLPTAPSFHRKVQGMAKSFARLIEVKPSVFLDHNQSIYRAVGAHMYDQTFGGHEHQARIELIVKAFLDSPATVENAPGYNGIALNCLFALLLAKDRGSLSLEHKRKFVALVKPFVSQVTPSGQFPPYGDDGEGGPLRDVGPWPAVFEAAASLAANESDAETFKWAARKIFDGETTSQEFDHVRPAQFYFLLSNSLSYEGWHRSDISARRPAFESRVVDRNLRRAGFVARDKLVLGRSREAGVPFVMIDLFARGRHAHREQPGQIAWYEANDTIFLHGLGYHNRLPEHGNQWFSLTDRCSDESCPGVGFPHSSRAWRSLDFQWEKVRIPTSRFRLVRPGVRKLDYLVFRIQHATGRPVSLYLRDPKLVCRSGNRFFDRQLSATNRRSGTTVHDVRGRRFTKTQIGDVRSFVRPFRGTRDSYDTVEFSEEDCTSLEFSYALSRGTKYPPNHLLMLLRTADEVEFDVLAHIKPFDPQLIDAHAKTVGKHHFASFAYDHQFYRGTRWERQLFLSAAGTLVSYDRVTGLPDVRTGDQQVCGPLWHLSTKEVPRMKRHETGVWFEANGFWKGTTRRKSRTRLLVWGDALGRHEIGSQFKDLWKHAAPQTVFAKQEACHGTQEFLFLHLPLTEGVDADVVVSSIKTFKSTDTIGLEWRENGDLMRLNILRRSMNGRVGITIP